MRRSSRSSPYSRRLTVASVLLGIFVLCDILLFSWLIFRSLSQREIERVLLETREEARDLAQRIASQPESGGEQNDLFVIMTFKREVREYINSELAKRDLVETVKIYDQNGTLVYNVSSPGAEELPDEPPSGAVSLPRETEPMNSGEVGLEISEDIGDLGTLYIGLSPQKLRERTAVLRQDLIGKMVGIMLVSLAVLASAYVVIWLLLLQGRRLEEKAREADRMATIGTLAAGLAHEIRNPLNSLNLNMQMLQEEMDHGCQIPAGRRLLSITRQEISRLERLVTDFLLYARPRSLELEEVAAAGLLSRVHEVLAGESRKRGVALRVEDGSRGAVVRVDAEQITQLLINLAQNALHATEDVPRRPLVVLAARLEGGRVVLSVTDNGVGIEAEERERIFEVFYSTRKGGTGLGLAVVESIARAHRGEIELESTPGEGTSVSLSLPVAALPREVGLAERMPAPQSSTTAA